MIRSDRVLLIFPRSAVRDDRTLRERGIRRGFTRFGRLEPGGLLVEGSRSRIPVHTVRSRAELIPLLAGTGDGRILAIRWKEDRVIPLEAALAARRKGAQLWIVAGRIEEAPSILGALEHGADLVVVEVRTIEELDRLERLIDEPGLQTLHWQSVRVSRTEPMGVGDRVIVDTTRLLRATDGLLVGSAASFLFSVSSEAIGSAFSRPRPFRVNAGSPHSYVLLADGTTRYLSELAAGDPVLICAPGGRPTSARVGRLKIERRPLILVEAEVDATPRTVFLQEAETVRLSGVGRRIPVTELRAGDRIQGVRLPPARHLGTIVDETIEER